MKVLLAVFCVCVCFIAWGKPGRKSANRKKSQKAKVVDIDFDDELRIRGKLLGPGLVTLFQKKSMFHGKLIKPRKDFLPEMRETLGDIE